MSKNKQNFNKNQPSQKSAPAKEAAPVQQHTESGKKEILGKGKDQYNRK